MIQEYTNDTGSDTIMSNNYDDTSSYRQNSDDISIDSIIEETRFLSEQERMATEAKRLSGSPKMEEIYSNTSKEVRLTNQNPLDTPEDEDDESKKAELKAKEDIPDEPDTVVTLSPEYDETATISEDIIDKVDGLEVESLHLKDVDTIDVPLDEEEDDATGSMMPKAPEALDEMLGSGSSDDSGNLGSFERLFGKPKPVGAVQTVVSRVPVYQHESKVDKVHVRAGKFSAVVETEYKKYLSSPNPVISQTLNPQPEDKEENEESKVNPKTVASNVMGKVVGFFSSDEEEENDFKEKTVQIEDFRSHQDAKSILQEVNSNIRKMFVNSIFTGVLGAVSLILSIVCRVLGDTIAQNFAASLVLSIVSFLLLLSATWVSRVTVINGLSSFAHFKGNSDSAAAVCAVCSILQGIVAFIVPNQFYSGTQHLYTAIAILALFLNSLGKLFMVRRVKENFKFVSAKAPLYAGKIYTNEDIARKLMSGTVVSKPIVAYQHKTDFLSDFLRLSYSPDPSEDMAGKLSLVTVICSLFVAVLYGIIFKDVWGAFSALAVMSCVCTPVCDLLAFNLPMYKLSKDALKKNAMISGYPSIRQFCDTKAVVCEARDLYPIDSVTLNGVKAFSNHKLESCMLAGAAVLREASNPMAHIFDNVVEKSGGKLPKVESVLYEDGLGLVGWVDGERILIGNRALLEKYAITPPSEDFEQKHKIEGRAVTYLARSNELMAMFVVTYAATLRIAELLQRAESDGISLLVQTTDCNVTGEKIAEDFGIFFRSVKVLPTGLGNVCREITSQKEDNSRSYLATRGSFNSFLRALCGCVKLKQNISLAVLFQLIGVVLGALLVATIALCAGVSALGNIEVTLFVAFWALATIIAPSIRKP